MILFSKIINLISNYTNFSVKNQAKIQRRFHTKKLFKYIKIFTWHKINFFVYLSC